MTSRDEVLPRFGRLLTRRSLALGALVLASAFVSRRVAQAQAPPGVNLAGDCQSELGVALLAAFNLGQPALPIQDLLPPLDWVRCLNLDIGLTFLHPPAWSEMTLGAAQVGPRGAPQWTGQKPFVPALTRGRIVSPDGTASFEAAVGTLYGAPLGPLQAAAIAGLGMAGETARLTPICRYEDPNRLAPAWFRATCVDDSVLVTEGYALPSPGAFAPNTIVTYYAMMGSRAEFEALMRDVYLRILFQFIGGGGEEPTPPPDD